MHNNKEVEKPKDLAEVEEVHVQNGSRQRSVFALHLPQSICRELSPLVSIRNAAVYIKYENYFSLPRKEKP